MGKIYVPIEDLRKATEKALKNQGYNDDEVKIISNILLFAQLRENNQGIIKLIGSGMPKDKNLKPIEIRRETKTSCLLDGNQNHGMIVLSEAVKIGLKKAEEYGISFVGTCNTPTSTGCLAYYANEITKAGFVCFLFAGSPASVAPYGSNQKLFGTNPLCIGVPSKSLPIILDMSTSSMAYYGLLEAKTAKKQVSLDIGFDSDGNPTTDPGKILDGGSIRTFDKGHKSGGLNLMVEILTGPLVQASFASFGDENNWGNLLIVLNPKLFTEDLKTEVENLVSKVKSLRKLNQNYEIYVPGEKGGKKFQQAIEKQKVEIETNLYYELLKVSGSTIQSKL